MAEIYKLWPAQAAICDPETGLPTSAFVKALGRIALLLGGENQNLPITFVYVPASGTAFGMVYLDGAGSLTSTPAPTNGQLLIGRTGFGPALNTLTGTVNRITVTNGLGTITLSTPQDLHSGASVTFAALSLTGVVARSFLYSGAGGSIASTAAPTNGQLLVGATGADPVRTSLTGTANQITVTNGAGSITLSLPQNIAVGSSPTFVGLTLSGLTANSFLYSGTSGALTSTTAPTNGQLLIGSTGAAPVRAALTGTANQITVTNAAGTITLSTPQNIATTSNVTFGSVTSTGAFGCNGQAAQTAATVNGAITGTAGAAYTGTEQTMINDLKALVNQLRTALINNGITV